MAKVKILKPYLDFEVGKVYEITTNDLVIELIYKGIAKEVTDLTGKKDI